MPIAAASSIDLRERVITDAAIASTIFAERYHVSRASVVALKPRWRDGRSIAPHAQTKSRGRVLTGEDERLRGLVTRSPGRPQTARGARRH